MTTNSDNLTYLQTVSIKQGGATPRLCFWHYSYEGTKILTVAEATFASSFHVVSAGYRLILIPSPVKARHIALVSIVDPIYSLVARSG